MSWLEPQAIVLRRTLSNAFDQSPIFGPVLSYPCYSITSEPIPKVKKQEKKKSIFMLAREDGVLPSRIDFQYKTYPDTIN